MGSTTPQPDVFAAVSDVVQSALDGYHVCLFSYGQTGSGKTHTMVGAPADPCGRGVIPRAIAAILEHAARLGAAGWQFALEATYVEIYNENVRDLLGHEASGKAGRNLESACIKHHAGSHTEVRASMLDLACAHAQALLASSSSAV